jgi:hypothetical protein
MLVHFFYKRLGAFYLPFIDFHEQVHLGNKAQFSFELSWLPEGGFNDLIEREWVIYIRGKNPIAIWQNK